MDMIKRCLLPAALLGTALMSTAPAQGALVRVVYTGTVADGYDTTGVFGTPDMDLSGEAFTATYLFDDTVGNGFTYYSSHYLYGGTVYGVPSPLQSFSFTIGGHTASPFNGADDAIDTENSATASAEEIQVRSSLSTADDYKLEYLRLSAYVSSSALPASFAGPFSGPLTNSFIANGSFNDTASNFDTGDTVDTHATLTPTFLTIGVVPEPASWALMLVGFGAIGTILRRRSPIVALARA